MCENRQVFNWDDLRVVLAAAKTGYIDASGYCLVQATRDPAGDFITVVLGCRSRDARNRASAQLIDYVRKHRTS